MSCSGMFKPAIVGILIVAGLPFVLGNEAVAQDVKGSSTVYVTVEGRNGSAVAPEESQMTVKVDKKPVRILSLRPAKQDKLVFAVAVDVSTSGAKRADAIRVAAAELFQQLFAHGGDGYLALFNQGVTISSRPITPADAQVALSHVVFRGGTALFDAMEKVTAQILSKEHNPKTRRVLVLVTDGDDDQSHTHLSKAEEVAEREGVAFFVLYTSSQLGKGAGAMVDACHATGGRFVLPGRHLEDGVAPLIAAIDHQRVLSVETPQSPEGKMHRLQVKTRQKDIRLSAPAQIFLP